MVYAMFIVFLLFLYIHTTYCQTTTTTSSSKNSIYNCAFLNNTYSTNAAVSNQFQFINQTSVILTAEYAFVSLPLSISSFELGLIYPFSISDPTYLVPFPMFLNCASIVRSCQLKTIAVTPLTSRDSEPINVPLTPINYTSTSIQSNQMSLYLIQGQYQLSNCLLNNGDDITDNQTIFNIQIEYEKSVGSNCTPSVDTCGSSLLTTCSSSSSTCTCLSSSSLVSYSNSFYCADTLNISNCTIFPTRCITWCNSTNNTLCICPSDTLKVQRNNLYVCELPVDSVNCSTNDDISRCPYGQACINGQCTNDIITTQTPTTTKIIDLNDPTDQRLRIALGVIAGLLGTSVIVLLGAFCWLRQRQKRRRIIAEKSLSPSSSTTSSLYISPIQQQQDYQPKKYPSINTIYQLPIENYYYNKRFSPIYRTDSFRQAVLSGHKRTNQIIEHVSTKPESSYQNDHLNSPTYSTLEFSVDNENLNRQTNNIYQVINQSFTPTILTHVV